MITLVSIVAKSSDGRSGFFSWHPVGFDGAATIWVHIILLTASLARGVDYAVGEAPLTSHRLGAVEASAPLWVWGTLFALSGMIGFFAMAYRWVDGLIWSHTLGTGLYMAIGVGLLWDAYQRNSLTAFDYGWPALIPLLTVVASIGACCKFKDRVSYVLVAGSLIAFFVSEASVSLDGLRNSVILFAFAGLHAVMATGTAKAREHADILRKRVADGVSD